jgi:general secretion pathway protein D
MSKRLLALAALLAGLLSPTLPALRAGESKLVQKHYQVADLVVPVGNSTPAVANPAAMGARPVFECEPSVTTCGANVGSAALQQQLVTLIMNTVAPDSWSSKGGPGTIDYFPLGMTLVINQTPDVQEQVADLLVALRRLQDQEVAVEMRIVTVDDACYERLGREGNIKVHEETPKPVLTTGQFRPPPLINDPSPSSFLARSAPGAFTSDFAVPVAPAHPTSWVTFLNTTEVGRLLETTQADRHTNVMQAPKLTLFNGQEATLKCLDRQFYVTGVETKWVGDKLITIPKNEPWETGLNMALQTVVSADQRFVRVRVKGTFASLMSDPVPIFPVVTPIQPIQQDGSDAQPVMFTQFIQLPRFNTIAVDRTLCIPDGGTALLYGGKRERKCCEEKCLPLWGELPIIGELFKSKRDVHYIEHLMLLVTPHVIVPKEEEIVQTGIVSNPALVQDGPISPCRSAEALPAPGAVETSEMPPLPAVPLATPTPDASQQDPPARMRALLNCNETSGPPRKIEPLFWLYDWALHPILWYDRIEGGIE